MCCSLGIALYLLEILSLNCSILVTFRKRHKLTTDVVSDLQKDTLTLQLSYYPQNNFEHILLYHFLISPTFYDENVFTRQSLYETCYFNLKCIFLS